MMHKERRGQNLDAAGKIRQSHVQESFRQASQGPTRGQRVPFHQQHELCARSLVFQHLRGQVGTPVMVARLQTPFS